MGFKALTVNTPVEQPPHILAEDDATFYTTVTGEDCVLPIGSQFAATVTSNNNVRIKDGVVIVGGHLGRIIKGDYEDMAIANGVSGQNRNDLIVARFISGGTAGIDDYQIVVVSGTPGAQAADPPLATGDLYEGDAQRDYPLWRIRIEGLSIVGVDKMFTVGVTLKKMSVDKLDKTGNAKDVTTTFTQAAARNQLTPGEKLSVSLGKIMKWFADLKSGAFAAVVNNLTTTAEGYALDARQGKALNDKKLSYFDRYNLTGLTTTTSFDTIVKTLVPLRSVVTLWINEETQYGKDIRAAIGNFYGYLILKRPSETNNTVFITCKPYNGSHFFTNMYTDTNNVGYSGWKEHNPDKKQDKLGAVVQTSDGKAGMRSDGEGGNFWLKGKSGMHWKLDSWNNEHFRVYRNTGSPAFIFQSDGDFNAPKVGLLSTAFGKKLNIANVINNLTTTASGYALDARQGRALNNALLRYIQINVTLTQTFNFTAWEISTVFWGSITSYLPSGAVIAGVIYCAAGSGNFASTNTQIASTAENKVNVTLCNMTSGSVNISSIRLGVWYHY